MHAGTLAFVAIPDAANDATRVALCDAVQLQLHPREWMFAESLPPARRLSYVAGRLAAHAAMTRAVSAPPAALPVLRTARGAPAFPDGILGSISHTRRLAVALVRAAAPATPGHPPLLNIGVDVETLPDPAHEQHRVDIAPRILTARELRALPPKVHDERITRAYLEAVRLRFSLKEAVYKAIDPWVQRHVRFQEVEVTLHADGTADVHTALQERAVADRIAHGLTITGWYMHHNGHCITGATATGVSS